MIPIPEPDDAVVERLALIAHIDIIRSVRVLSHMIWGDREGWRMHGWRDSIEQILVKALDAGGAARTEAVQLLEYLARRGFQDLDFLVAEKGHTKY